MLEKQNFYSFKALTKTRNNVKTPISADILKPKVYAAHKLLVAKVNPRVADKKDFNEHVTFTTFRAKPQPMWGRAGA